MMDSLHTPTLWMQTHLWSNDPLAMIHDFSHNLQDYPWELEELQEEGGD
jgi:hypothetical protein